MELKGTKTEKNLWKPLQARAARNKYTYFASMAKKEGYEQLAAIFEETAGNEEHAKIWFKLLCGGAIPDTLTCLDMAAGGEHDEWTEMYPAWRPRKRASTRSQPCSPWWHRSRRSTRSATAPGREPEEPEGVRPRRAAAVAVPELRLHLHRQVGSAQVPGVRTPQSYFELKKINY